jgi:hypothetical protein
MRNKEQVVCEVDNQIVEQDLPESAILKVVRRTDPNYGLTQDEIQDRDEFIRCYMLQEFESLMMIPKQTTEYDFFIVDCIVDDEEYSAFNTHDFQRQQRPFNKYAYAMKQIMERVKDLAIMHSCISSPEDRQDVYRRHEMLVDREFREQLISLTRQYRWWRDENNRQQLKQKIAKLNRRIIECRIIWERYAPFENWDH